MSFGKNVRRSRTLFVRSRIKFILCERGEAKIEVEQINLPRALIDFCVSSVEFMEVPQLKI